MDSELLERLACPFCITHPERPPEGVRKGELRPVMQGALSGLQCQQCKRIYPFEAGLPKLLIEEAILPVSE